MHTTSNLRRVHGGKVRFREGLFAHTALTLLPDGAMVYVLAAGAHAVHVYTPGTQRRGEALCTATRVAEPKAADRAQTALTLEGTR